MREGKENSKQQKKTNKMNETIRGEKKMQSKVKKKKGNIMQKEQR